MIRKRVRFLDRKKELSAIFQYLQDWGTSKFVCIHGPGGIGKTRLMQEIGERFQAPDFEFPLSICDNIDFDDVHFHTPQNVGNAIAGQLGLDSFWAYLNALNDMQLAEYRGAPAEYITRSSLEINNTFIDNFNRLSSKKRIVLRFDTTDALRGMKTAEYILQISVELQNALVLFAGKDADAIFSMLKREVGDDAILMPLNPFDLSVGREYLLEKQEGIPFDLDSEWAEKLIILSDGFPILIDMAFDWVVRDIPIPRMQEIALSDLQRLAESSAADDQEKLTELRTLFRKELVAPIRRIESDVDRLMLVLAKTNPLDVVGIGALLGMDRRKSQELFELSQSWTTIKVLPGGRIKLHDEVQYMLLKYVWPEIDPGGNREKRNDRRAIDYLTDWINNTTREIRMLRQQAQQARDTGRYAEIVKLFGEQMTKERELWTLSTERLRCTFSLDVQEGYRWFLQDYQGQMRISGSRQYQEDLIAQVEPYTDQLSREQRLDFQRIRARHLTDDGDYELAAQVYRALLTEIPINNQDYVEALVGRGNLLLRTGDIPSALNDFEEALSISQGLADTGWIAKSLLALGYANHLAGELGKAAECYQDAYRRAIETNDRERQALALNSVAHVYAIQKREQEALGAIEQAIALWKELVAESEEHRFRLGQSYNTAGEIYIELDHPEKSLPHFELAWGIFDRTGSAEVEEAGQSDEWKSRSRSGRGFARWLMGDLENAQDDLEWAEQRATAGDYPVVLHRLSHVYWDIGEQEKAQAGWRASMDRARQVGDMFTELNSLSDLARIAFEQPVSGFDRWQEFEAWYKDYCDRYSHPRFLVLEGLLYTYLGNLALRDRQTEQAIRLYGYGFPLLARAGTFAYFNLGGQLDLIETRVLSMVPAEFVRQIGKALLGAWSLETSYLAAMNYFRRWSQWSREPTQIREARDE